MKRTASILLAALVAIFGAAACGGDAQGTGEQQQEDLEQRVDQLEQQAQQQQEEIDALEEQAQGQQSGQQQRAQEQDEEELVGEVTTQNSAEQQ